MLSDERISEFKICHGVMLLLYAVRNNAVPMALLNVHTGKLIQKFSFDRTGKDIEFLEQFNEKIMVKTRGHPLKIFNSWSNSKLAVDHFEAPEAFIFLYEKEKFLTLKQGRIEIWTSEGRLITNFAGTPLCSKINLSADSQDANYIVSVSQSKRFLFAF